MTSFRVLLADDDGECRELAAGLLTAALPLARVVSLTNSVDLGFELATEGRTVLITQVTAGGVGVVDLLATVRRLRPEWSVVLLASAVDPLLLSDAIRAGLAGYLPRDWAGLRRLPALVGELLEPAQEDSSSVHGEMEEFASVVGHDLQEPLQLITRYGRLVAEQCADGLGAEGSRYVEHMVASAERLQTMVDGLLQYSRVGRRERLPVQMALDEALDEALANLEDVLLESGASVTRDPLPEVAADRGQMVQLFQNLVANAVKFHADEPPRIHVAARLDGDRAVLAVRDNGIGIDPAHHRRIFGMFQRLHSASEVEGSGVGLAVCARIVERHGGRIWVDSERGRGATFHVELPVECSGLVTEGRGSDGP